MMSVLGIKGFINCRAYLRFKPIIRSNALLVINGKVVYAGSEDKVVKVVNELGGDLVDLGGNVVIPGFVDAHLHLAALGESLRSLDLRGVRSIDEIKKLLRDYAVRHRNHWIIGYGWDQELFTEGRWVTKSDLDEVVSYKPVILFRVCGHVAVLNSKALEELGILERFRDSPNLLANYGIIREEVLGAVVDELKKDVSKLVNDLMEGVKHLLANGVTTAGIAGCDPETLYALQLVKVVHGLPLRVRVYLSASCLDLVNAFKIVRGLGDDYLKILGLKVFVDGSLGARTALLSEPYSDAPDTYGVQVVDKESLMKVLRVAAMYGLQVATHAIGDKAIDIALGAYSEVFGNVTRYRHRVEHLSVIREDQVVMARELGIVGVVQPHFILSDWWVVNRVGLHRVRWVYPLKTLYQSIPIAFSSDAPVEPVNPWETVYAAVTRGFKEGLQLYTYTPHEVLNTIDSLHAYTMGSAYALFSEDSIGSLEVGKYADFVVIDRDPLEVDIEDVRRIRTLETYVGGVKVFSRAYA